MHRHDSLSVHLLTAILARQAGLPLALQLYTLLSALLNRRFYADSRFDSYHRYLPGCELFIGAADFLSPNMKGAKENCFIEIRVFLRV